MTKLSRVIYNVCYQDKDGVKYDVKVISTTADNAGQLVLADKELNAVNIIDII